LQPYIFYSTLDLGGIRAQPLSYSIIVGVWAMSSSRWENFSDIRPIPVVNQ